MIKILFFGRLRDIAGRAELACELPPDVATIAELRAWLAKDNPLLGEALGARGVRVAVDRAFCAGESERARGAAEIAFMSPLSGG